MFYSKVCVYSKDCSTITHFNNPYPMSHCAFTSAFVTL